MYPTVFTDTSLSGWGGWICFGTAIGDTQSPLEMLHINFLELQAVLMLLQNFSYLIQGRFVGEDRQPHRNCSHQEAKRSLHRLVVETTEDLWALALEHLLSLRDLYVPGPENRGTAHCIRWFSLAPQDNPT